MSDTAGVLATCAEPPTDSVSSMTFGRESDFLAVSSWDSKVRVYDGASGGLLWTGEDEDPLLDCKFGATDDVLFAAGLGGRILSFDPTATSAPTVLGSHGGPVSCLAYDAYVTNTLLTGGWDGTVQQWDIRAPGYHVASVALGAALGPFKAYTMDLSGHLLVVGGSARAIELFDVRRMDKFVQTRESSLASQTRVLRCSPDGERFVVAGMEGRIAVEMIDPSAEAQAQKYAFKAAQQVLPDKSKVMYPVHALAFHPTTHVFAAAGQNGALSIWDAQARKRVSAFPALSPGIVAACFSRTGARIALAQSYAWEHGDPAEAAALPAGARAATQGAPTVVVRKLTEAQVRLGAK